MTNRLKLWLVQFATTATLFGSKTLAMARQRSANGENINGNQNGDDSEYQSEYPRSIKNHVQS